MSKYLIKGAKIVNEGVQKIADVLISEGIIQEIDLDEFSRLPVISVPILEEC